MMNTAYHSPTFPDNAAILSPVALDDCNDASSAYPLCFWHRILTYKSILHINT